MQNLKDKVDVVFAASGDDCWQLLRDRFPQHGAKVYVTARNLDAVKAYGAGDQSQWRTRGSRQSRRLE